MDKDKFKNLIGAPCIYHFADKHIVKKVIIRTVRLTLQYPEYAKEYYDNLYKVTNKL